MEQDPRAWIAVLRNSHERLASLTPEQLRGPAYPTGADLDRLRTMFPGL